MKNIVAFILSIALVVAVGFGLSSCKEDEPPVKPKLSFAETEIAVNEDDGALEVELVLDKAHSKDLRIEYELGGTASDQDVVGTANADYEVEGDHGVVEIAAGQTSGTIELNIYADAGFEPDETIEIVITDTNTDEIELTADDETVITVANDDEQITASFATTTMTANESDGIFYGMPTAGLLEVAVQLDKAATQEITIEYTLDGSAFDSTFAFTEEIPSSYYDYYVDGVTGELTIPAGQTTGNIEIQLYADFMFEDDETIEITLTPSNDAQIGTNNVMTITLEQQNGKVIALIWENAAYTDVDMDLFLWFGEDVNTLENLLALSANPGPTPRVELVFIPAEITDGIFGLSHNYYSGSADPLNFEVHFADFADGILEAPVDRDVYTAAYTAVNKNEWDKSQVTPPVVQTFSIVAGDYVDITEITVPTSGSRIRTPRLPSGIQRSRWQPVRPL